MPLAVTHVLLTIILIDLFRDYVMKKHKRYLTLHILVIAGIASLLPDIDIPITWIFPKIVQYAGITHTAFFGLIFLIPAFIFLRKKRYKTATIFFIITFGVLFHLFLDYFLIGGYSKGGIMWLWPFSSYAFKIHLLEKMGLSNLPAALDAVMLLVWLWHEEVKHKIKDFI